MPPKRRILKLASVWPLEAPGSRGVAMEMCSGTRRKGNEAFRESRRLGSGRSDICSPSLLQLLSLLSSSCFTVPMWTQRLKVLTVLVEALQSSMRDV